MTFDVHAHISRLVAEEHARRVRRAKFTLLGLVLVLASVLVFASWARAQAPSYPGTYGSPYGGGGRGAADGPCCSHYPSPSERTMPRTYVPSAEDKAYEKAFKEYLRNRDDGDARTPTPYTAPKGRSR